MPRTGYLIAVAVMLAAAAAGVLVWTNYFEIPGTRQPIESTPVASEIDWTSRMAELATNEGLILSLADKDTSAWSITDGHKIERFRISGAEQVFARLSSGHPLNPEDRLSGLQVKLPLEWAQKINGKRIEVGVVARQPSSNGASDISVLYATLQTGNSGWRTFKVSPNFQDVKFEYNVPLADSGYIQQPIIVLRSDVQGADRAVELVGVYIKPVP